MADNYLREAIEAAKEAAKGATGTARELLGRTNDPDLMLYERLSPADFDRIAAEEGPEEMERYIRSMETRRLRAAQR